jgi:fermentation-respiration switch protein FrsA (DUF1100 family)
LKRRVLNLLLGLLLAYAAICLLAYVFQGRLVYFPMGVPEVDPSAYGLAFEEVELVTEDGVRLHAWYLPAVDARGAILFSHGNAGHIGYRLQGAQAFLSMGCSVLLYDYRGYGRSEGRPDEQGTYRDGEAAWEYLTGARGLNPSSIVLYGESLGAGVAFELASRHPAAALITESAFTSLDELGAELYPWLPVRLLGRIHYDNRAKLEELDLPLLLIHSPQDDIVPFAHAKRLFEAAKEPRTLLETGGGHNDGGFLQRSEWRREVSRFLDTALSREEAGAER